MAEINTKNNSDNVYAFLYKERTPFAKACLFGSDEKRNSCGSVSFYTTPLGVLIRAELTGLPKSPFKKKKAYSFCIRDAKQSSCQCADLGVKRYLCVSMPTAYEKNGMAECVMVTRRLAPSELVEKSVFVYERACGCPKKPSDAVAFGEIAYF